MDVLPLGKQSVAVTVDVQAPASMNLNQEATLKLIVRNTGAHDALNVVIEDELPEGLQFISSVPEMQVTTQSHLTARIATLSAGSDRTFSIRSSRPSGARSIMSRPFGSRRDAGRVPSCSSPS